MKRLFSTALELPTAHIAILLLRVVSSSFMLTHGIPKLQKLMAGGEIKFGDPLHIGAAPSLVLSIFAELVCQVFILLGLGTRIAALPWAINMAVAGFIAHSDDPFNKKELALLFFAIAVFFMITGSGKYSVDYLAQNRNRSVKINTAR